MFYHVEHHLFPAVPTCNLGKLAARLDAVASGYDIGYTQGMKTAISLPDELYARTEIMRKELGLSRSEICQKALREYFDTHSEQAMIEAINSVLREDPEAGRLDPVLERMQFASLPVEKWT